MMLLVYQYVAYKKITSLFLSWGILGLVVGALVAWNANCSTRGGSPEIPSRRSGISGEPPLVPQLAFQATRAPPTYPRLFPT